MTDLGRREPVAFNAMPESEADAALSACCASRAWVRAILAERPYASAEHLGRVADDALAALSEADVDEALAAHPRIGDVHGHSTWSQREQAGAQDATERTLAALAAANRTYEERFGHVYLVCATGRSADELLGILHARLGNHPATERAVARAELGKINRIRLKALLSESEAGRAPGFAAPREEERDR